MSTTQLLHSQRQLQARDKEAALRKEVRHVTAREEEWWLQESDVWDIADASFCDFYQTNNHRGKHYSLEDFSQVKSPRLFSFMHRDETYLATVFTYEGPDDDWLTLEVPINGFHFPKASPNTSKGWAAIPADKYLPHMTRMGSVLQPRYSEVTAYYNGDLERIDFKFYPATPGTPLLRVTFEPGYPDQEDQATPYYLSRKE